MSDLIKQIYQQLFITFSPVLCEIKDESSFHVGHYVDSTLNKGGHYHIHLISAQFETKDRLMRHRLIYDCLANFMKHDIHALTISASAPSEV